MTIVVSNAPEGETVTAAVAFEKLTSTQVDRAGKDNPKGGETRTTDDDNKIAEHKDINDNDQTVRSPRIATNANFAEGATQVENGTVVVDTVDYSGLIEGKTYTLTAELKERLGEAAPYGVGRTIGTGTETFKAEAENGKVDVRITVDGLEDGEQAAAAVAFEELTSTEVDRGGNDAPNEGGNKIAEHKDINDGNQTVEGPVNTPTTEPSTTTEETTSEEPTPTTTIQMIPSTEPTTSEEPAPTTTIQLLPSTEPSTAEETTPKETTSEEIIPTTTIQMLTSTEPSVPSPSTVTTTITTTKETSPEETTSEETTSEEPTPTTTIQMLTSTEPSTEEETTKETTSEEPTPTTTIQMLTSTEATTEVTTSVAEPSTSETAPSSTPVVPLVPSNPDGKIDTKVTVNGKTIVDGKPVTVTEQDVTNGLKVTDEITYSGLVAGAKYRFEGQLQHVEFNEAGEVVKVTPVTEVKLTDVLAAENGAGTATVDFGTLTELTAGETYVVYERAIPLDGNNQPTTNSDGTPKDSSKDNRKVVEHKDPKDKAQTFEVVKTPTSTPTSPAAPTTTPDNCVPVTTVSTVPGTTVPETTVPGTTGPETTVPGTTVPGTTVKESTTEVTTVPETCASTPEEEPTPETSDETSTEPTEPTAPETSEGSTTTVPAQPGTSEKTTEPTKVTTSEQPTKPTTPAVPSNTTTPVVPPVVWFPNPQIGTNADFANGAKEVVSGTVVNDTVKYQGLVPGKTYTLTAELVSKDVYNELVDRDAYGDAIIGTGTKTFTCLLYTSPSPRDS